MAARNRHEFKFTWEKMVRVLKARKEDMLKFLPGRNVDALFTETTRHIYGPDCPGTSCRRERCRNMRSMLMHNCTNFNQHGRRCDGCCILTMSYLNHAMHCNTSDCGIPFCEDIKEGDYTDDEDQDDAEMFMPELPDGPAHQRANPTAPIQSQMDRENGVVLELYDLKEAMENWKGADKA